MKKQSVCSSDFYCTRCGARFPLVRKTRRQKEPGHLKKIYCYKCKDEVNHAEVKLTGDYTYEDFKIEFEYGNFTEDGQRELSYRQFKAALRNSGVI